MNLFEQMQSAEARQVRKPPFVPAGIGVASLAAQNVLIRGCKMSGLLSHDKAVGCPD